MRYYNKIDLDNIDIIIEKSLNYVKLQTDVYLRKKDASFYWLNASELLEACPEINQSFSKFGLTCNYAAVYITYKKSDATIHVDDYYHKARINIPLLNCKGSFTNFYSNVKFEKVINEFTKCPYLRVVNDDYKLEDRVEIDQATVILTSEAHMVDMNIAESPRIALTLGFDKDPAFLIPQDTTVIRSE